jgi:stage V sporulation protein B
MLLSDVAISQVIEGVGKLVFGLAFAALGHRIDLPLTLISALTILGVTIGNIFGFIYLLICYKTKISKEKRGQNSTSDKKRISRSIFSISIPITVSAAILSISGLIDLGLIMRMLESIGYTEEQASSLYGNYTTLAVPMFNLAMSLISPITIATLPTIASSYSKGDLTELVDAEKNALDLTSLMAAPMMVGLIIFAKEILTVLFKNSNIDLGVPLLILISPSIYFSSLLIMVNSFLESYGYVKAPMISMLFGGIAKTLAAYFLIKDPRIGISGAPISTVLSYGIALSVSLIIYSKKTKRYINVVSPLIRFYLPALVIVLLGKILYKRLSLNIGLFLSLIISIAFIGILYSLYIMFINKSNKSRVLKLAKYTKFS